MTTGQRAQVTLKFNNIGSQTWIKGRTATALYLYGDSTIFKDTTWLTNDLPGLINEASVKPGQTATATFWVKAPSTPGIYEESFLLSYGTNAWVKGSRAYVKFVVLKGVATTVAATSPAPGTTAYSGLLTEKGGTEWQFVPAGQGSVTLGFKNTGTATWINSGVNYVSLYTGRTNRVSPFRDATWKNQYQPTVMKEATVRPGETGHFTFQLKAPVNTGTYSEEFILAAEDKAWIAGATALLPIKVGDVSGAPPAAAAPSSPTASYKGMLMLSSAKSLTLSGSTRQGLTFGIKNTGSIGWSTLTARILGIQPASAATISVRDESWPTATDAAVAQASTAPGQIGFIGFTVKAPVYKGDYTVSFKLYADGQEVQDAVINIPITVTADGYIEPTPQAATTPSVPTNTGAANVDLSALPDEPIIRVGLYSTIDDKSVLKAVSGGFSLYQGGSAVCNFGAGESVTVSFDRATKIYRAQGPNCSVQSANFYQAWAPDLVTPLEVTDYNRPVSWLPGANDNKFRGKLELRYTPSSDLVWLINELPVETYLKWMAETSNSSPLEYQKALMTAARTYAMYHVQRGTKHAAEFFTVDAKYDQVYRGYGAEIRDPNVVAGIDATRGQIVTYAGKLAITPYYSRSDGRTRSWTEVWGGGPYAWLVSVPVPWDQGRTLWGHGVGMSATGALGMAADGKNWVEILKHFYTGIELQRIYK
ncbi:MAG: SpoIID/LytB domain-containing protein [Alphaproteobacteria bacterium]|nr:SpoIID/LytB domain-containing protein [Alphaproteobacteria bacterium]